MYSTKATFTDCTVHTHTNADTESDNATRTETHTQTDIYTDTKPSRCVNSAARMQLS